MTKEISILVNLFAQSKIELDTLLNSFNELNSEDKKSELAWLRMYMEQSHPTQKIINKAIENSPIKMTMTPIVILMTNNFSEALT